MNICRKKIKNNSEYSKGMTYVEVIVVLSIFSALTSVIMFNYGDFQDRVDMKSLASDIALKVVEAQKSALSGLLPPAPFSPASTWKPSYGIYFNSSSLADTDGISFNKKFIYFTDISPQDGEYNGLPSCTGECLTKISITKNNYIERIDVIYTSTPPGGYETISNLTATFSRPDSGAMLTSTPALNPDINYVQIITRSPKGASAIIRIFASGRIQVN